MRVPRVLVVPAIALAFTALASSVAPAQAPHIRKPQPAPPGPPPVIPLPPAQFDSTLAVGGQDVKAKKIETRLSVDVLVNGRGPYRFIVDSGADTSAVGLRIAHDLQLPLGTPALLSGMTARNIVDRVKVDQLTLGPTTVTNLQLPALREVDVGGDGLIGIDALVKQRLLMDFDNKIIKVEDASNPAPHFPDEIVVTARRQRGQLILTHVRAAGLSLDAVIDTGTEITIGNLALRDKLLRHHQNFFTVTAIGVTGVPVKLDVARIAELELGPITLYDVPMAFADVPPFETFGLSGQPSLLLGTDILEHFRKVSLDFRSRKVRFQLRRCGTQGITIATTTEMPLLMTRLSASAGGC